MFSKAVNEEQAPVQLWTKIKEEDQTEHYYNLGSKRSQVDEPGFRRGGILADDMVGKNLRK